MKRSIMEAFSFTGMASPTGRNEPRRHGASSHPLSPSVASTSSTSAVASCSSASGPPLDRAASSSTARDSSRHLALSQFNDIFKCTICFGHLEDPHLCPQCSKLYCYECITEWLDSGSSQCCPNCKTSLRHEQLVKVRWFEDVQKLQQDLRTLGEGVSDNDDSATDSELCPLHRKVVNFYCSTCKTCVCEVCATEIVAGSHQNHSFKTLHVTYEQHAELLENELERVEHHRDRLSLLHHKIGRNIELIGTVKSVKQKELEAIMASALRSLDRQEEEKLSKLCVHQCTLMRQIEDIDMKLQAMRFEMSLCSKPQLIRMKSEIVDTCNAIRSHPIKDFKQIRVPASLKIEIPDFFETGVFVVQNFSTFDDNKVIYSNEFSDCQGRTWRIMAWCVISEDHFGIYLELVSGRPCWMECTFQLIHLNPEKTISKTIRQYFDRTPQKGWGLRDFVTLKTILDEDYVRVNDSLELLYNIRPCKPVESQQPLEDDESLSDSN
uniref:RING-type domain-containing protein n=1 Tax=Anopheles dirus TaxID=7168 RepID=A0A182NQG0_9DIPT